MEPLEMVAKWFKWQGKLRCRKRQEKIINVRREEEEIEPETFNVLFQEWRLCPHCSNLLLAVSVQSHDRDHVDVQFLYCTCQCSNMHLRLRSVWHAQFFFFFGLFAISWAALVAYGGSQARGPIGAVATGLRQSHSNAESKPCLQPTPQLTATPDR